MSVSCPGHFSEATYESECGVGWEALVHNSKLKQATGHPLQQASKTSSSAIWNKWNNRNMRHSVLSGYSFLNRRWFDLSGKWQKIPTRFNPAWLFNSIFHQTKFVEAAWCLDCPEEDVYFGVCSSLHFGRSPGHGFCGFLPSFEEAHHLNHEITASLRKGEDILASLHFLFLFRDKQWTGIFRDWPA